MSTEFIENDPAEEGKYAREEKFTTNEEDRREVAKLQERLSQSNSIVHKSDCNSSKTENLVPSVSIAEGAHKYVLISAREPISVTSEPTPCVKRFVVSSHGAPYHRNVAEPFVEKLQRNGYQNIQVLGGGRIFLDDDKKKVSIFGFSYGFGQADHRLSKDEVEKDPRYVDYEVTYSNEGY